MKRIKLTLLTLFITSCCLAQTNKKDTFNRNGLVFGAAMGTSSIYLSSPSLPSHNEMTMTFPNIKLGTMLSERFALLLYLPGTIYSYKDSGRIRKRGFEGIVPTAQYWIKDRWWVNAGAGFGMDAPVFYDIKNEQERKFYFGKTALIGTGYEFWRRGSMSLDLQGRVHYSAIKLPEGNRSGTAVSIMLGINWY